MHSLPNKAFRILAVPSAVKREGDMFLYVYLMRRVSFLFSFIFSRASVHPNTITVFSILSGISGALAYAMQIEWLGAIGIIVWFLLDCVDGEVARVTNKATSLGARMEIINSDIQYAVLVPAIMLGLFIGEHVSISWVIIAFTGANLYNVARKLWGGYPKKILGEPSSRLKIFIAVQFKGMRSLRAEEKVLSASYYLRQNIITQSGIPYPLFIGASFLSSKEPLILISKFYAVVYLGFALLSFLILFVVILFRSSPES